MLRAAGLVSHCCVPLPFHAVKNSCFSKSAPNSWLASSAVQSCHAVLCALKPAWTPAPSSANQGCNTLPIHEKRAYRVSSCPDSVLSVPSIPPLCFVPQPSDQLRPFANGCAWTLFICLDRQQPEHGFLLQPPTCCKITTISFNPITLRFSFCRRTLGWCGQIHPATRIPMQTSVLLSRSAV